MTNRTLQVLLLLVYSYQIFAHEYVFAVQWDESVCRLNPGGCIRGNVRPKLWTIHGLWPPQDLPSINVPFNMSALGADLTTKLNDVWPSIYGRTNEAFWEYEWSKHGTQAINDASSGIKSQEDFFRLAVTMLEELQLYSIFEDCKIVPREDPPYEGKVFVDCLQKHGITGNQFSLMKLKRSNMLLEVRICFDGTNIIKERKRQDCVKKPPECLSTELLYPPKVDATTITSVGITTTSFGTTTISTEGTTTSINGTTACTDAPLSRTTSALYAVASWKLPLYLILGQSLTIMFP